MDKWPIGVFASIDAGLGVKLEVAQELAVPTIQLHAPAQSTRTEQNAADFLKRLNDLGIRLTAVLRTGSSCTTRERTPWTFRGTP